MLKCHIVTTRHLAIKILFLYETSENAGKGVLCMTTPLPTQWSQAKRKSGAVLNSNKKPKTGTTFSSSTNLKSLLQDYEEKAPEVITDELRMYVDQVLDSEPFEKVLMDAGAPSGVQAESVPVVTRKYEEQFMRECISPEETPCAMGNQCECMFLDLSEPFVGTVFVLPTLNDKNNLCVLCLRKTTHLLFYHLLQKGLQPRGLIQIYGNICNQEGEYHPSAMLICPPSGPVQSLPLPIVAHQRNRYSIVKKNNIRYVQQHCVGMQDFCQAPSNLQT